VKHGVGGVSPFPVSTSFVRSASSSVAFLLFNHAALHTNTNKPGRDEARILSPATAVHR
jgi:hypothetical protein